MENYKDPEDLRMIPLKRLEFEGNRLALQFKEWNDIFNIESAIRVNNRDNNGRLSELNKWSILSNRYLLMDREDFTQYKLFTKEEVLKLQRDAYNQGYNDSLYQKEENTKRHETEQVYLQKQSETI